MIDIPKPSHVPDAPPREKRRVRETFIALCNLYSFMSYCQWVGNYPKAVDTAMQIVEIAENHKVLNFFAKHLYRFFL